MKALIFFVFLIGSVSAQSDGYLGGPGTGQGKPGADYGRPGSGVGGPASVPPANGGVNQPGSHNPYMGGGSGGHGRPGHTGMPGHAGSNGGHQGGRHGGGRR
jgi:hypothetical protein